MKPRRILWAAVAGLPMLSIGAVPPGGATSGPSVAALSVPFTAGRDGFDTYRIPALAVTPGGTVLAFAEGRASRRDQSHNTIVLRRSTDGGKTWGPLQVVADHRPDSLNNPTVVVLAGTERVLVVFQRYPADRREATVTDGVAGNTTCLCFMTASDDDGKTWSDPVDITPQVKRPTAATSLASGPGVGIQLHRGPHAGRIVIPFNQGPLKTCEVYTAFSDDGGRSWRYGELAPVGPDGRGNETQVVELSDGRMLMSSRPSSGRAVRKQAVSDDGGSTWSVLHDEPALPDPHCQGSLIRLDVPATRPTTAPSPAGRLLFAHPADEHGRTHGTIYVSDDDGKTWPTPLQLVTGKFAYCCLAVLPDGSVGCLYEAEDYRRIELLKVTMNRTGGLTASAP